MADARIERLADILVNYSVKVRKNDVVLIDFSGMRPLPLVEALYKRCLKKGAASVEYHFSSDELTRLFFELAGDAQLNYFPRHRLEA
ncbi:MAG: aminopeptidase, partial [Candidatus Omnitrophota bacterium]